MISDFLQSQGDLQIHFEEWQSFQKTVAEDVAKLPFTFTRKVTYSHPRTTMLMFGPKYAPSSQEQYLYLPCLSKGKSTKFADLQECKPGRGIILTITQLDGIPMSDVFRVLQYWSFEFEPSSNMKTKVRSGVALHYLKSSMFKGQIFSGVKDELTEQVQKWLQYAEMRLKDFLNQVEDEQNFVERASSYSFDDNSAITSAVARRRYSGIANMPRQMPKSVLPAAPEIETAPVHIPTAAANAGPVETGHVLLFLVGVLLFILFVQWMANRGLVYQIDLLNRKIEANQKMIEAVIAETQQILEKVSSLNQN